MSDDINDFLLGGGGAPSASFENVNDTVRGTIVDLKQSQERDFNTKELKTWDNGDPMMQLVITLQTDERDPDIEDDDGRRVVYAPKDTRDGTKFRAIADAVKAAKSKIEVGGTLAVQFTGTEPSKTKGFAPRKLYQAAYKPAEVSAASALLDDAPAVQAAPAVSAEALL